MDWYRLSKINDWEFTEDEFIDFHKTRSIPPVKSHGRDSFRWYKISNYPYLILSKMFGDRTIEFRRGEIEPTKIVAFDGENAVGIAAEHHLQEGQSGDGIWVSNDYRRLGIGLELLSLFRSQFPSDRRIGEMSPSGEVLSRAYHRRQVELARERGDIP